MLNNIATLMAPTPLREFISQFFGYVSLFFFGIVMIPQIIENYRNKSAESVSVVMLYIWLVGDILNLIGGFTQGIIFTALLLATYFIVSDLIVTFQVYYYRFYYNSNKRAYVEDEESDQNSPMLGTNNEIPTTYESTYSQQHEVAGLQPQRVLCERKNTMIRLALSILLAVAVIGALCIMFPAYNSNTSPSQNTKRKPELSFWPQAFGYLSTTLYVTSRIPQIMLNYKNKSCEGLSLWLFIFTLIGNLTYILAFFADSMELDDIVLNLPWILGAAVTPVFDMVIFYQFYIYK